MTQDTDTVTRTRRLVQWLKDKIEQRKDEREDHDPWWVTLMLDVGRPAVAIMILVMCAPGEHYLGVMAGWTRGMAWLTPASLTAYAGISAVVATKRPKGAPGRKTAVCGAVLSILIAMGAQPLAHLYEQGWITGYRPALTIVVSCVPAAVFGHLLHMGAAAPGKIRSKISSAVVAKKIPQVSLVKSYPAGPVGRILSNPESILLEIKGRGIVHSPVVYFIQNGNRVKIGTSTNMVGRLRNLSLRITDILMMLHGDRELEVHLHERFAAQRVGTTEWFELSGELADYIEWKSGRTVGRTAKPKADRRSRRADTAPDTSVSRSDIATDTVPDAMTWTPDTVTPDEPDTSRTPDIGSGSLASDVRTFLTDNPDATNDKLYAAMRQAGRTEPDNSIYVARKRHERKIGQAS